METKLARKPLETANLAALSDSQVLSDVKAILGYKVADNASQLLKLAGILKELDIEPFDPAKVAAYKAEMAKSISKRRTTSYEDPDGERYSETRVTKGIWKTTPLQAYAVEVPAFALLRAAQIKKAMNLANIPGDFHVEELHRSTRTTLRRLPDPFMVLHTCGKKLYIDVWNEPKFEGRRTK